MKLTNNSKLQDPMFLEHLQNLHVFCKELLELPEDPYVMLEDSAENAAALLGKTAYYDPSEKQIVVFVTNRHPKDILRSFSHEMVHHSQNCCGQFDEALMNEYGDNVQKNEQLRELEREAYLKGSMNFRDYEDGVKQNMSEEIKEEVVEETEKLDEEEEQLKEEDSSEETLNETTIVNPGTRLMEGKFQNRDTKLFNRLLQKYTKV